MAGQLIGYIVASPFGGVNNSIEDHMADALRGKVKNLDVKLGFRVVENSR